MYIYIYIFIDLFIYAHSLGVEGLGFKDLISWATGFGECRCHKPSNSANPNAPNRLGRLGESFNPKTGLGFWL